MNIIELERISNSIDGTEKLILYNDKSKELTFKNTEFISLDFYIAKSEKLSTKKLKAKNTIDFLSKEIEERILDIEDVENIYFKNCKIDIISFKCKLNNISIDNSHFNKVEFYIENTCTKISITNSHFKEKLKIRNPEKYKDDDYEKPKLQLKSLEIENCTVGNEAYLRLGFLECDKFMLSNLRNPKDAEVNIGECIFKKFHLINFRNMGKFKIYNIESEKNKEDTKFQIDNTSIGDADFQNINLKSFDKVVMYANIFSNLHYTIIQWKDDILANEDNTQSKDSIEIQQDTYRTLKNVATKNNDKPQALIFFAKEMKSYKKLMLEINGKCINGDILTLKFNECTNKFGLSWTKPLILLLIVSCIFYVSLLYSITTNDILSENIIGKFFVFINPIHNVEFIFKNCWNNLSYVIDGIFRLIEGLLIYQTIQGFRKYSRSL